MTKRKMEDDGEDSGGDSLRRWANNRHRRNKTLTVLGDEDYFHPLCVVVIDMIKSVMMNAPASVPTLSMEELTKLLVLRYKTIIRQGMIALCQSLVTDVTFDPFSEYLLLHFFHHICHNNIRSFSLTLDQNIHRRFSTWADPKWADMTSYVFLNKSIVKNIDWIPTFINTWTVLNRHSLSEGISILDAALTDMQMMSNTAAFSPHFGMKAAARATRRFEEFVFICRREIDRMNGSDADAEITLRKFVAIASYYSIMCYYARDMTNSAWFTIKDCYQTMEMAFGHDRRVYIPFLKDCVHVLDGKNHFKETFDKLQADLSIMEKLG